MGILMTGTETMEHEAAARDRNARRELVCYVAREQWQGRGSWYVARLHGDGSVEIGPPVPTGKTEQQARDQAAQKNRKLAIEKLANLRSVASHQGQPGWPKLTPGECSLLGAEQESAVSELLRQYEERASRCNTK